LDKRPLIGLAGVIVTALASELNDQVSGLSLPDIQGGLGMGHDAGTWFSSLYVSGAVIGLAIAPWWAVTFTLRRFTLFVIVFICTSTLLVPFAANLTILYGLRTLQGVAGGLIVPILMATALRVLSPNIRLWGLMSYALTATFFPNLSAPVAALWTEFVGWHFAFFQAIPLCAIAAVLVSYGLPEDKPQYSRFQKIDWRGMMLVVVGMGAFTTLLQQGDRFDWFNSQTICVLALISAIAIPLLLINEWFQEIPLLKLQLLARRNLAYGAIALFCFIILSASSSTIPFMYLEQVQQFRPVQLYSLSLEIALLQLVFLPIVTMLLNIPWLDPRVLHFLGFSCIVTACVGDSYLTSAWNGDEFILWQVFQAAGGALVVMPLLMMATNTITPQEGPFGAVLVNTPRGLAEAVAPWLIQLVSRWRGSLHSDRIADQLGLDRFRVSQLHTINSQYGQIFLPSGVASSVESRFLLSAAAKAQTEVLLYSDAFLVVGGIAMLMMILLFILPVRTYPPRIMLAHK
jgi:DHA2 family multidrug resistance protein